VLLGLVALALVDSINPSAIVVTLYLLSRGRVAAQVAVYTAAIFLTYLTLGTTMMSGIDALLPSLRTMSESRLGFIVQGLIGLAMLLYAIRAPATARSAPRVEPGASTSAGLALLGITVTTMELPTAVPYFARSRFSRQPPCRQPSGYRCWSSTTRSSCSPRTAPDGPHRFRKTAGCALR
jgi:hypothetical protein